MASETDNMVFNRNREEMEGLSEGYFSILDTRGGSRDWSYQYDQNITPGLLTQYHNSTEILMMES